ncbi:MAG: peptidoglycan DD-metalloendopeptidase family protein, partial [Burkholderiaceae bacterium]
LAGCGSRVINRAPVEDRGTGSATPAPVALEPGSAVHALPGAENNGKPGYYTVKPGDTLIRIGLETGQNWRDVAHWNNIDNPNVIEVGQVLRVVPPGQPTVVASGVGASGVVTRPVTPPAITASPMTPASAAGTSATGATVVASAAPSTASAAAATTTPGTGDDNISWMWPAQGTVISGFDEAKNKGLDIGGVAGEPIYAAADGRVVYVGASLRGYGNLIILKHNNTFLTAYAHNKVLLVKEDQTVHRGQKIAEMGSSDADRVKLHFEVRRQGKPVDPIKYLPAR